MREVRIAIRWRDLDAYGHVNNAVYLNYLEEARDAWVEGVLGPVGRTWDFVLARVAIDFRAELKLSDEAVIVACALDSIGRASVRTREKVSKLNGEISAESESVIVPVDPQTGRPRPLTGPERSALERELAESDAGDGSGGDPLVEPGSVPEAGSDGGADR